MRIDMHEIIIERPRYGHADRYPRRLARNRTRARVAADDDSLPLRESLGGFYRSKSLSENLAPLVRYLRSNIGRPWAKVHSDISERLSVSSAVQKHVLDHLRDFVIENVVDQRDGQFWGRDRHGRLQLVDDFFVHPRSAALAEQREPRQKKSRARLPRPDMRVLSATEELRRVRGIWYQVTIAPLPHRYGPDAVAEVRDAIAKVDPRDHGSRSRSAEAESMRDLWRDGRYATNLRQLSSREIRRLLG